MTRRTMLWTGPVLAAICLAPAVVSGEEEPLKFEYLIIKTESPFVTKLDALQKKLDELGADGWEMVNSWLEISHVLYHMKRSNRHPDFAKPGPRVIHFRSKPKLQVLPGEPARSLRFNSLPAEKEARNEPNRPKAYTTGPSGDE